MTGVALIYIQNSHEFFSSVSQNNQFVWTASGV